MKYIVYLFYRYYNKGSTQSIAYESSLLAILSLLFVNLLAIANFFELSMDFGNGQRRISLYLIMLFCYVLPGYLLLRFIFPKKEIVEFDKSKNISIHGWILLGYILLSVLLLVLVINK